MPAIHVDSRKWPDQRHWQYDAELLGDDAHGTWLFIPPDTVAQRGEEPPRTLGSGFVTLVPETAWWVAEFYWKHPKRTVYVNIGTPPEWHGNRMYQVDLDLDVVRNLDGSVEILDEDEFLEHQVRYSYPTHVVTTARTTADHVVTLLEQRVEPFDSAAQRWIERALDR